MANVFEQVIIKMIDVGMFQFMFPFMMTSAIFYGLLRKSQILGKPKESVTINAVVSLVAAFMVWASPIILGIDIETHLAAFFVQGISVTLVVMIGLMIVGMMLPPDLPQQFKEIFKDNTKIWTGILIVSLLVGVIIIVSSGMVKIYFPNMGGGGVGGGLPTLSEDTITTWGIFLLLAASVLGFIAISG